MRGFALRRFGVVALLGLGMVGVMVASGGDLDPPAGPVAPTMKNLDEVEARIALNQTNTPGNSGVAFIITEPGSYYLTEDVTTVAFQGGIDVQTGGVTIDLNGYTLRHGGGTVFNLPGIFSPHADVTVRNGTVDGFRDTCLSLGDRAIVEDVRVVSGLSHGIEVGDHSLVHDCIVNANGQNGLTVGESCTVRACAVSDNGGTGIVAGQSSVISHCTAIGNGDDGMDVGGNSRIESCTATDNTSTGILLRNTSICTGCVANFNDANGFDGPGYFGECVANNNQETGFDAGPRSTLRDCTALGNFADGIAALLDSSIIDCSASRNTSNGIRVTSNCLVRGNRCETNGFLPGEDGAGIFATEFDNRIESNTVMRNRRGIDIDAGGNIIVKNSATGNNGGNFVIAAGNDVGTIQASPVGAGAWDNFEY